MTDVLRPSLYGAVYTPITVLPGTGKGEDVGDETESVVVVGHCCESGDLMTPMPGEPEALWRGGGRKSRDWQYYRHGWEWRILSTKNYNSFPEAPEVLVDDKDEVHVIRKHQPVEKIWENEVDVEGAF
jgi:diaminopimelate decarboxylase